MAIFPLYVSFADLLIKSRDINNLSHSFTLSTFFSFLQFVLFRVVIPCWTFPVLCCQVYYLFPLRYLTFGLSLKNLHHSKLIIKKKKKMDLCFLLVLFFFSFKIVIEMEFFFGVRNKIIIFCFCLCSNSLSHTIYINWFKMSFSSYTKFPCTGIA